MKKINLHQFLSQTGLFSSKKAVFDALRNKEVTIDGKVVTHPRFQFRPGKKKVLWMGRELESFKGKIYILLNKPSGYISSRLTKKDISMNKKSVFSLIDADNSLSKSLKNTLFCIGRLDEFSTGLLIITNDGYLGSRITEPVNKITKTYEVSLEYPISAADVAKVEKGVVIDLEENSKIVKYKTKPCRIERIGEKSLRIIVSEGKKREVRRIFQAVGNKVVKLRRVSIGKLNLDEIGLEPGEHMFVQKEFIEQKL